MADSRWQTAEQRLQPINQRSSPPSNKAAFVTDIYRGPVLKARRLVLGVALGVALGVVPGVMLGVVLGVVWCGVVLPLLVRGEQHEGNQCLLLHTLPSSSLSSNSAFGMFFISWCNNNKQRCHTFVETAIGTYAATCGTRGNTRQTLPTIRTSTAVTFTRAVRVPVVHSQKVALCPPCLK